MDLVVRQAGAEVERVDRMVGSAEAISEAVGSASRLVGGVVTEPLIRLVALGSGVARVARVVRSGARRRPRSRRTITVARENRLPRGPDSDQDSGHRSTRKGALGRRPRVLETGAIPARRSVPGRRGAAPARGGS